MRNFIITKIICNYCPNWKIAKVLARRFDIELVHVHSGDPRIKLFEPISYEKIPMGIIYDRIVGSSLSITFMISFLKNL